MTNYIQIKLSLKEIPIKYWNKIELDNNWDKEYLVPNTSKLPMMINYFASNANFNEKQVSKLNEEIEELSGELLEIKNKELEKTVNDYKTKLEEVYHGYLDIFLETNNPTAKKHLLKTFDDKTLKELSEKQEQINELEARINQASQQAQVEILPPSYN